MLSSGRLVVNSGNLKFMSQINRQILPNGEEFTQVVLHRKFFNRVSYFLPIPILQPSNGNELQVILFCTTNNSCNPPKNTKCEMNLGKPLTFCTRFVQGFSGLQSEDQCSARYPSRSRLSGCAAASRVGCGHIRKMPLTLEETYYQNTINIIIYIYIVKLYENLKKGHCFTRGLRYRKTRKLPTYNNFKMHPTYFVQI